MSETTTTETTTLAPQPGTGHLKQTFLVGETVYLRGLAKSDATYSAALRNAVYPRSTTRTENWLTEGLEDESPWGKHTLAIVRKADDAVVGFIESRPDGITIRTLTSHVDRLLGDAGQRMRAEAMILIGRHILEEMETPAIITALPASDTILVDALQAAGWIQTARHREMLFVDGQRTDRLYLQAFNQEWVDRLGHPMDIPLERTGTGVARPVPPPVGPMPDAPKNALMVGKRVYLRALKPEDAKLAARVYRTETETFYDIGRHLPAAVNVQHWLDGLEKKDPPEWVMIGVYLRENDLYIGDVMLINVDYVNRTAETGSFFHDRNYRGAGYGSEAKQLLLEYAFEVLDLHMVESWVLFPNTRSAAALRKQGYTEAGRMCWAYPYEGGFNNGILFDFLREEWRAMPRKEWE